MVQTGAVSDILKPTGIVPVGFADGGRCRAGRNKDRRKRKMSRKGENIFKRKDGRWEARYIRGYDADGKARYGYCYAKSYAVAKDKAAQRKTECAPAPHPTDADETGLLGEYCDEWLAAKRGSVHEASYVKYRRIAEKHIKPHFGGMKPEAVTTEAIDGFSNTLLRENALSPKTVRDILTVLGAVLKHAARQCPGGLPEVQVHYPKEARREMRVLTREEQTVLTEYLTTDMDECKFGVLLSLMTGLRIGELCALKWGAISPENNTVRVAATMQRLRVYDGEGSRGKTRVIIGEPKSKTSARLIPLSPAAAALCRRFCPHDAEDYVLTGTRRFMEPRALQHKFKRYMEDCRLENVSFHALRHTFATRCVEVGFELKSLSEVLGHASTKITLERYVHSSVDFKRRNMQKLAAVGM